jgi:hypothetical protein
MAVERVADAEIVLAETPKTFAPPADDFGAAEARSAPAADGCAAARDRVAAAEEQFGAVRRCFAGVRRRLAAVRRCLRPLRRCFATVRRYFAPVGIDISSVTARSVPAP